MPERRYRILAIASHPVQYAAPLFRRMSQHPSIDLHVAYCTMRGAQPGHDPDFGATVHWDIPLLDGYRWSLVPNRSSGGEKFFGLVNPGIWNLIRDGKFDAILCYTGYLRATFWIAYFASRLSHTAFLFGTDATSLIPRDGRAWKLTLKKFAWPALFRLADQIIAPSTGTCDLMHSLGLPPERVTLIPYVVDNSWWMEQASLVDRALIRASWGAGPGDTAVLFCAKLQPWKRPGDLLRAFAMADVPNAILVFAGDGPLRQQLESQAATLGIASRVRFLGFINQSQLPAVYTSADLMVLPSEYEPFAVVVNEAMCCGCPVIVSDRVGAGRDLVSPVAPQFIYPCGALDALAGILKKALSDRALLASIAMAGVAHLRSWSPEINIAATLQAVSRAVSRVTKLEAVA